MRLSGPDAAAIVSRLVDEPPGEGTYVRLLRRIKLPDTGPFPVILYVMRAPRSYTREDVVEIHAPGSPPLLAAILAQTLRLGARQAEAGEFTKRAFLNGRIDLAQAEAVLAIIQSASVQEERMALSALTGHLGGEVKAIRDGLVSLAADIEAGLDFFEEDVTFAGPARQAEAVDSASRAVASLVEESTLRRTFREEVIVVIYGAANAGKSSLFNMLAGDDIAIVRDQPGTTRDILEAAAQIGGVHFLFVDTAGVRTAAEVIEKVAVERTRAFVREAHMVLFVVDASETPGSDVETLYEEMQGLTHIVVLNKADKGLAIDEEGWRERYGEGAVLEVSSKSGDGREALEAALVDFVRGGRVDMSTARFALAERQRRSLEEALDALGRAAEAIAAGAGDEFVSLEIKEAATCLGRITGEDYAEDLLDEVFSRFCLGK